MRNVASANEPHSTENRNDDREGRDCINFDNFRPSAGTQARAGALGGRQESTSYRPSPKREARSRQCFLCRGRSAIPGRKLGICSCECSLQDKTGPRFSVTISAASGLLPDAALQRRSDPWSQVMQTVADLTIEALRNLRVRHLPLYEDALRSACAESPPPYGMADYGDLFRSLARDVDWMATSLVANAGAEGDGANRLWNIAASTTSANVSKAIKRHAIDESRHAAWYISILTLVFPDAADDELRSQLESLSPDFRPSQQPAAEIDSPWAYNATLDDLIQMNIAEIRTRIHHLLQRPFLMAYCRPEKRHALNRLLDRLLSDETKHIAYTAELIEGHLGAEPHRSGKSLFHERICDFNDVTYREMNDARFPSCAQCRACKVASA